MHSQIEQERVISDLNRGEIMALFERYDFTDSKGHRLTLCQDFLDLVELATQ